jgi:hypothetical protein
LAHHLRRDRHPFLRCRHQPIRPLGVPLALFTGGCQRKAGPLLRFHQNARVAWVGWADARGGRPVDLTKGAELDLRGRMASLRGYLAIAGGIDVPQVLGSRATDLRAGFGGWQGRALLCGDRLPVGRPQAGPATGAWRVGWPRAESPAGTLELRFLKGMQWVWFAQEARGSFQNEIYQISPVSDRMGARLDGPPLTRGEMAEMVSQPVVAGSVQVPPDGQPIVLLADAQTIGGYPQIGHVISADLPRLARAWPGPAPPPSASCAAKAMRGWSPRCWMPRGASPHGMGEATSTGRYPSPSTTKSARWSRPPAGRRCCGCR